MAKKKAVAKKRQVMRRVVEKGRLTEVIPTPPPGEEEVALNVEIPGSDGWRIRLALLLMESKGVKTTKKKFVSNAISNALDRFEEEWGDLDG